MTSAGAFGALGCEAGRGVSNCFGAEQTAFWLLTRRREGLPLYDTFEAISRERVLKKMNAISNRA